MQVATKKLSRKDVLKMGLLGSAAVALPLERAARTQVAAPRLTAAQLPAPFQAEFAVPPIAQPVYSDETTDYYEMSMKEGFHQILPEPFPKTEVWGYEGLTPGPTIVARRGRNVKIRHKNEIQNPLHEHTSVHLHGNASAPQYDGYANDTTAPGEYKDYVYPNNQDARTLWYHDHGVHVTGLNAYMGCAAFYISHDEHELSLPIPHGGYDADGNFVPSPYDVPIVIRDAIFGADGQMIFDDQGHSSLFGDVILVNGAPWPVMKVEKRKYRFRLLNGSISRGFNLALSDRSPMTIIGHDGGLAPEPVEVESFRHGMAERYEVVIDFSRYEVGESVELRNLGLPNTADFANTNRIMRFDVVAEATDLSNNEVPDVLGDSDHPYNPMKLDESQSVRTRRFELGREIVGGQEMWTINNRIWDPARVDARPELGAVEIWEFQNKSGGWFHPTHIHLVDFRILDRRDSENGTPRPPHPYERGPKDVVYIGEGEWVRVIMKFGPQKGKYMIHCHNLVHEDHDMMTQFEVGTGGTPWAAVPAKPISEAPPLYTEPDNGGGDNGGGDNGGGGDGGGQNVAPTISVLRPAPGRVTRDRTPTIVAKIQNEVSLSKGDIELFVDRRRITSYNYDNGTGILNYTCRRMRLGWHNVAIRATDEKGLTTTKAFRFRVVIR